ncbi:4-hydroxy-2-oxovalerate aldolase [Streptomyces sp. ISL-98]|uniref:4-hydroxy-2-oxovalerate aldolase n=1 Tax=Streptomyces sp. ISL-98 TaxID=2819192 RepID=UPI001BE6E103|nr:4-hydroxy-2-oxovalerate aldolase [Streptomyces sp. ISL-98]MBT2505893.1 4-hydroxy-2-oxovalerate aldolase [Streptomyces sp. ISL-98]
MTPDTPLIIHDATLRDGQHAVRHQLDHEQIRSYATAVTGARVPVVEIGHGNGLGASSLQIGRGKLTDDEMLSAAREALTGSRMAVLMAPGWGTSADLRNAVIRHGADVARIAVHCTEANATERHLNVLRELGAEAQGVLMMSHMASPEQLAEQCALMAEYGAQAVGLMDSAGHYLPGDVTARIEAITAAVNVPVLFHGHNNLGMAVANSVAAVQAGARIIDACARGFGAGAGNTQLEVLVAVLERYGYPTGIDLRHLADAADLAERTLMPAPPTIDSTSLASGLAGVFSGFKTPVLAAADKEGVHPWDLFFELGDRQIVAGQEDTIPDAARSVATQGRRSADVSLA